MTIQAKLLCAVAVSGFAAMLATAPAQALSSHECSVKYQAAKTAGTLNGQKYADFRKAECAADTAATPAAAPAAAPAAPPPPVAAEAKPKKEVAPAAAPVAVGNAVFPSAIDPKFASEKPHMARMHTCSQQWQANKAANTTGGMHWNQKGGGGFYPECNKRLKT
jgi:hypothetical protein